MAEKALGVWITAGLAPGMRTRVTNECLVLEMPLCASCFVLTQERAPLYRIKGQAVIVSY